MKKTQIPTPWIETSRVSKACFPHLFSMSVSLISFSSQATGRSSNWSIATLVFYLFEGGFAFLGHYYSPGNRWFNELRSLTRRRHATAFRVRISFTTLRDEPWTIFWFYCGGKTNLTSFLKLTTKRMNSVSASLPADVIRDSSRMYQHVFFNIYIYCFINL